MNVYFICMIHIIFPPYMKGLDQSEELRGKLVEEVEPNYIVDFSEAAKERGYTYGDYTHVSVGRNMCRKSK